MDQNRPLPVLKAYKKTISDDDRNENDTKIDLNF